MTNIEIRTNEAVQSINRKMRDQNKIDWEQRRYEIAKGMLPFCAQETVKAINDNPYSDKYAGKTIGQIAVEAAVRYADVLIEELKWKRHEEV